MSPIILALAALLAYRTYQGKGRLAEMLGRTGAPGDPAQGTAAGGGGILASLGSLLGGAGAGAALSDGLADLIKSFQQAGQGQTAQTWVDKGPNQTIEPSDIEKAIGPEKIDWLMRQTGMSRQELMAGLSRELPAVVDQLTPEGRVPTEQEAARLVQASREQSIPDNAGEQPEALATFAATARNDGVKPVPPDLHADEKTKAIPVDPGLGNEAATRVLREGVLSVDQGSKEAIDALPDRTRTSGTDR